MDYIPLIAATARLIDLHDSDRSSGQPPAFVRESRTGRPDGFYLDLAALVIECLKIQDKTAPQEYMPMMAILRHVRNTRPEVDPDDVAFVLNVLRRPTELFYIERGAGSAETHCVSEKRKTVIIEKTDYADEYRLSVTGRMLPQLVNAAKDSMYLRGDAYNLLHAIQNKDFRNVRVFSDEIVAQLRNEILEIQAALERVGKTETVDKYVDRFEQYSKVIEETLDIVRKAEEEIDKKTTAEEFAQWLDNSNADITFGGVRDDVMRVRRVLMIFNRRLAELVHATTQHKRIAVPPPSFLNVAASLVRSPFTATQEAHFFRQWSAVTLETPLYSVLDCVGAVPVRDDTPEPEAQDFANDESEPLSQLGKLHFMAKYGQDIADHLQREPLKLSLAISRGWFVLDDLVSIGSLVGVFVAPDTLPIPDPIEIRVSQEMLSTAIEKGDLMFSDLELVIGATS